MSLIFPDLVIEGQQMLGEKVDRLGTRMDRLETKVDRLEFKVDALEFKVDAVAADLSAHRADTEAHHGGVSGEGRVSFLACRHRLRCSLTPESEGDGRWIRGIWGVSLISSEEYGECP